MTVHRRKFLHLAGVAVALPFASRVASAQAYPSRPVRIIVGVPPGATADIIARLIGQWLQERLGQPFVIENRPGASTNIAVEAVLHAPADGYTLLWITAANAMNATIYEKLNFNFIRNVAPVVHIIDTPLVMVLNPSTPVKTVSEFITYANNNPGRINMASSGNGTPQHVSGELFKMMTGVNMIHVPYRGDAPAIADLLGGQVQVLFSTLPGSIEYIRTGKLRALAVTTAARLEALPSIPTISEFVPGFEASGWLGIGAPGSTPAAVVERLNTEINVGLADRKIKARLADLGAIIRGGSAVEFGKHIADETEKWAKVIRAANIKVE
jgi:tripartite-type tricarboxylate transporter receptor subunit TctC